MGISYFEFDFGSRSTDRNHRIFDGRWLRTRYMYLDCLIDLAPYAIVRNCTQWDAIEWLSTVVARLTRGERPKDLRSLTSLLTQLCTRTFGRPTATAGVPLTRNTISMGKHCGSHAYYDCGVPRPSSLVFRLSRPSLLMIELSTPVMSMPVSGSGSVAATQWTT